MGSFLYSHVVMETLENFFLVSSCRCLEKKMRNNQNQRAVGRTPLFSLFKPMRLLILVAVVYFTQTYDGHLEMII